MILVDTSVWVDHLRSGNDVLTSLLRDVKVLCHPFVVGELACGSLARRDEVLSLLGALPQSVLADHREVMAFLETRRLMGTGIGWVDVHLLSSAALTNAELWTLDKRLAQVAHSIDISAGM